MVHHGILPTTYSAFEVRFVKFRLEILYSAHKFSKRIWHQTTFKISFQTSFWPNYICGRKLHNQSLARLQQDFVEHSNLDTLTPISKTLRQTAFKRSVRTSCRPNFVEIETATNIKTNPVQDHGKLAAMKDYEEHSNLDTLTPISRALHDLASDLDLMFVEIDVSGNNKTNPLQDHSKLKTNN